MPVSPLLRNKDIQAKNVSVAKAKENMTSQFADLGISDKEAAASKRLEAGVPMLDVTQVQEER